MATSLREQIAKLSSTVPELQDPEDYFEDDTAARLAEKGEDEQDDVPLQSSSLRKRAAVLLPDDDEKYAGKKTSRKKLNQSSGIENEEVHDEEDEENEDFSFDENSDIEGDNSEIESELEGDNSDDDNLEAFQSNFKAATLNDSKQEFSFTDDGDYGKYADDDDMMGSDEDDDDDENGDDKDEGSDDMEEDVDDVEEEEEEGAVKSFSHSSVGDEVQRGESAKQQLGLWDSFLEGRIKLQKVAGIINQLPQFDVWRDFEKQGGDEFKQSAAETQAMLKKLLDKLVQLQTILLLQNAETKHLVTGQKPGKVQSEEDEEIPSDTDEEEQQEKKQEPVQVGVKRKIKMENYPEFLAKRHKDFQTFRNNTIQKWYDKTRLAGGKLKSKSFSSFDQSALKQIEQILGDQDRLVKRTQLKRSVYTILGKEEEEPTPEALQNQNESEILGDNLKTYDPEIFDDNDFYHQQLRELIERKTADVEDPVALSRQWLEIQKLRNKVKKKIDTRASKGRKTRYNVHSKLVNFMAQFDNCSWTDDSKDDLFKSLFGKRFLKSTDSMQSTETSKNIS